jgi:hypothetical protein
MEGAAVTLPDRPAGCGSEDGMIRVGRGQFPSKTSGVVKAKEAPDWLEELLAHAT